jgi:hypothetical protein
MIRITVCILINLEISFDELFKSVQNSGHDMKPEEIMEFHQALDANKDGWIDYEEWRSFLLLHSDKTTLPNVIQFGIKIL